MFRSYFNSLLSDSSFSAFRWETPPIAIDSADRDFEFVLLNSPSLDRSADIFTFEEHFPNGDDDGIVVFDNVGKDAVMVVPCPQEEPSVYTHLASFVRGAPPAQIHALWRSVGETMQRILNERPLWLSTAGGGVAWLHVRLDSWPKYYGHSPYRVSA